MGSKKQICNDLSQANLIFSSRSQCPGQNRHQRTHPFASMEREGKSAPLTHNPPVSPDHRQSDGRRANGRSAIESPLAGRGQCPTDKVDEGELESERAPWCDGGSAKVGCPQRERAWEWNFAPLFSRGAEIPASASPLPRVRFDRGAPRGRERLKKSAFRLVFPQLRPLPSLPPVTSPRAASSRRWLNQRPARQTNQAGWREGAGGHWGNT